MTKESLHRGIAMALAGNRIGDVGHAVQAYVEENGFSVVRSFVGHGVGKELHEDPEVPNYGTPGRGQPPGARHVHRHRTDGLPAQVCGKDVKGRLDGQNR